MRAGAHKLLIYACLLLSAAGRHSRFVAIMQAWVLQRLALQMRHVQVIARSTTPNGHNRQHD